MSVTSPGSTLRPSAGAPFPREEYEQRWARLYEAMRRRGHETVIMWQRAGGGYDRAGDVVWLSNYASFSSGQEPEIHTGVIGRAFAALVFHGGEAPVLHTAEEVEAVDRRVVTCGEIVSHANLPAGVARHLRERGIDGPVAHNGDDFIPMQFAREFAAAAPGIELVTMDDALWDIHRIKSPREQEVMREAGAVATRAMNALMEGLIAGRPEADAAAAAAAEVVRAGGGIQRIGTAHGPRSEHLFYSDGLHGYTREAPRPGDVVRAWIYGPLQHGYWLDPGRTAVVGNDPTPEQRRLVEGAANVIEELIAAIKPGVSTLDVGRLGDRLMDEAGNDADELWDFYGHGAGKDFYLNPVIPRRGVNADIAEEVYEEGMAATVELFLLHRGVGLAGFERTGLIGPDGWESLDTTPMIWW